MTSTSHPSYPNPTIQEAICEIRFRLNDGQQWNPTWYGEFFKEVQEQFPNLQPGGFAQLQFQVSPANGAAMASTIPIVQIMRYQHISRGLVLHLAPDNIAIHVVFDYPGWHQLQSDIQYAWEKLRQVVVPAVVLRIGLRYINRIERSTPEETLDSWLKPNEYIPGIILRSGPGFVAQIQARKDSLNRQHLIVGDQDPGGSGYGAFILDIDRIREGEFPPDTAALLQAASELHEDVWQVFDSARNDKLERLLQGEVI